MALRSNYTLFLLLFVTILVIAAPSTPAQSIQDRSADKNAVLVLPFENASQAAEFNWVGESFSDALSELLNLPGQVVVSSDERELAYQQIGFPQTTLPSLASAIKLGRETKATMIVIGTYQVISQPVGASPGQVKGDKPKPEDDKAEDVTTQPIIQVSAKVLKVNEGRYEGNPITLSSPLSDLQYLHGRLAYELLYANDKTLPYSQNQIIAQARKVPQRAFESYAKGLVTSDPETRLAYLTNATREYVKEHPGQDYPQAAFELAHVFFDQKDWKRAAFYFSKITRRDPHYAESAFYAALSYVRSDDYTQALTALLPLTSTVPLTAIYNNAGAISIMAARAEKAPNEKARLIEQGSTLLARAAQSSALDDTATVFNFAYALFAGGKYMEAAEKFGSIVQINPRDGEAQFLLAKSLE
ncbi:MAG: tetratricopeptide repeat protein, partial [Pyrinomonadaceae bacterium]